MKPRWRSWLAWSALMTGCGALAMWQYHEYRQECAAARETLTLQADSVMTVLLGGIRSHRRLGQFLDDQIQTVLEELAAAEGVLAVAIRDSEGATLLSAGEESWLAGDESVGRATTWERHGLRVVREFQLTAEPPRGGGGGGGGGGFGWGRAWLRAMEPASRFTADEVYQAVIVLDRSRADQQEYRAAQSRTLVALAGMLVLVCIAAVWRATVRLAQTRGALEAESRHLRELNQAAAGLAHETRNPLGLIRGWTQRLVEATPDALSSQQHARAIVEECDRVVARINQFLAFARPAEPQTRPVQVSRLIEELGNLMEPDLRSKRLVLRPQLPDAGTPIIADSDLLRQMLFNLMQNAVQWSPEGAPIDIRMVRSHNGRQRIEVLDRGPGVDAQHLTSLFTPYFTTRRDGTGLGLAIVRRLASAQGWEVGCSPRPGGGSVFWMDGIHE